MSGDVRDLLRELAGEVCRCGQPKRPRQTFCRACYYRLPPHLRAAVYRRLGEGYEEAYDAAIDYLAGAERTGRPPNGGSPR